MASSRSGLQFIDDSALASRLVVDDLVEGILQCGALGVLFGQPGSAKTFLALDLGLSVATGLPWLGAFAVGQGPVVYVAAEGGGRLGQRVEAWKQFHRVNGTAGVQFLLQPVQFHERDDVRKLLHAIAEQLTEPPVLLIIDTLARCFQGGEESSAKDMGLFVAGIDKIRCDTGAAVLAVHHPGHRSPGRERGSSALRAAADTMMTISRDSKSRGPCTLRCEKQKDGPPFDHVQLKLRRQIVADGEESLVLEPMPRNADGGSGTCDDLPSRATKALETLGSFDSRGATHAEWLAASHLKKATFNRALSDLLSRDMVLKRGDRYVSRKD